MQTITVISNKNEAKAKPANQHFFQPRLTVNQPNDAYEQEADSVADKVMRMPAGTGADTAFFKPAPATVQRKCQHCEEEEKKVHRKASSGTETQVDGSLDSYVSSLGSSGRSLSEGERGFFEPRFGHDFSNVRIHNDTVAAKSAQSINALAYTTGNNIVFNTGQYSPESDSGKRLMAHELTHVIQQGGGDTNIQRTPSAHTHCLANTNGAPADPIAALTTANTRAVNMALGASNVLFSDSLFMQDPAMSAGSATPAFYHRRFGDPPAAPHGKFRNRFAGTLHDSLILAKASEMQFLSRRLAAISHFLERNINFKCGGAGAIQLGDCSAAHCLAGDMLISCPTVNHGNDIAICSGFWGLSAPDQQAIGMIHEVGHMMLRFHDHDTGPLFASTDAQRRTEPECYASLVADIFSVAPFDPSCPAIP